MVVDGEIVLCCGHSFVFFYFYLPKILVISKWTEIRIALIESRHTLYIKFMFFINNDRNTLHIYCLDARSVPTYQLRLTCCLSLCAHFAQLPWMSKYDSCIYDLQGTLRVKNQSSGFIIEQLKYKYKEICVLCILIRFSFHFFPCQWNLSIKPFKFQTILNNVFRAFVFCFVLFWWKKAIDLHLNENIVCWCDKLQLMRFSYR